MQESTTHTTHTSNSQTERSTHNTFVDAKSVVQEPRQDKVRTQLFVRYITFNELFNTHSNFILFTTSYNCSLSFGY